VGSLKANLGVVELKQELSLADVVAFLHQYALDGRRDWRVCFKVLDGFNLSVGGNQAGNGPTLDRDSTNFQRGLARKRKKYE